MVIDLREVNVRWINLDSATANAEKMEAFFQKYGFKHAVRKSACVIPPPPNTPPSIQHFKGCAQSHIELFEDLTNAPTPLLTLEDDVEVFPNFDPVFQVPDGTDAVYLGISTGNQNYISNRVDLQYLRIGRMLAHHAVLYLTDRYRDAVLGVARVCQAGNCPFDVGVSQLQEKFRVLTPNFPVFFQSDERESANKWQFFTDSPIFDRRSMFPIGT